HRDLHHAAQLFPVLPSRLPPPATLFPYTTLFRSDRGRSKGRRSRLSLLKPVAVQRGTARARFVAQGTGAPGKRARVPRRSIRLRSEEHTSELQSLAYLVCRLLLEKKNILSYRDLL